MLASSERRELRRGQTIFSAEDSANYVFFLELGTVKIYHLGSQGEVTIFWFCVPGDVFGAGGISGAQRQSVYGQATERTVVYALPRPAFESILLAHPRLALNVLKLVGGRLRLACDAVTDNATRRTDARLARVLLRLGQQWGAPTGQQLRFGASITNQELGNMVGASRQTVNRIMMEFVRRGWIAVQRRRIILIDNLALTRLVDG